MTRQKFLDWFQKNAYRTYIVLGYTTDNFNVLMGMIIEMRNIVVAVEKNDSILMHKHMGICSSYVANYCEINNLKLSNIIDIPHKEMESEVYMYDLEYFMEQMQDEVQVKADMTDEEKYKFVRKVWIAIFPNDYHDDWIKAERILQTLIEDNKIKYPDKFPPPTGEAERHGLE